VNRLDATAAEEARLGARRAAVSAIWSAIGRWGMSLISVITLAVTARLLGPSPFGVFALATSLTAMANILVAGSLTEALIQRSNLTDEERRAGFWITAPIGFALLAAFAVGASFFDDPAAAILPWCALGLPLSGLASAPFAMLIREHRFRALSAIELAAAGAGSCIGIGLALGGHGVFSLVFQELTRELVRSTGAFLVSGYRPGAPPPLAAMASVFRFGAGGLGVAFLVQADRQIPRLIIGLWLGAQALGIFTLAMKLFDTLSQLVLGPFGAVAMSTVARLQHNLPALRALATGSMRVAAGLAGPGFLGLAAVAPVLVPTVFGASWAGAVASAQILLLIGIRSSASTFNIAILRGVGMSREPILITAVSAVLTAIMTAIAAPFGVLAVATAILLRSYSTWPLGAWYVKRAIGLGIVDQAKAGALPVAAALVMAVIVYGFVIAANDPLGAWPTIALAPLLGVPLYALLLRIVAPGDFGALLKFIKTRQTSPA